MATVIELSVPVSAASFFTDTHPVKCLFGKMLMGLRYSTLNKCQSSVGAGPIIKSTIQWCRSIRTAGSSIQAPPIPGDADWKQRIVYKQFFRLLIGAINGRQYLEYVY